MTITVSDNRMDQQMTFAHKDFGLEKRLTKAVAKMGYQHATLVQRHCIPLALKGKDLLVRARTGSGKTIAFLLPIFHKILCKSQYEQQQECVKALILVPTKELVSQTTKVIWDLAYYCQDVITVLGLGGEPFNAQKALLRDQPRIIVSTPGKLIAHLKADNITLKDSVETMVLDEADMLLSLGYEDDIRSIISYLPSACQSFFMSATLSPELDQLKKSFLRNPVVIKLEEGEEDSKLQQFYVSVNSMDKDLLVYALLKLGVIQGKVLFFVNDTESAYRLKLFFEQFCIPSAVLNAELPFNSRQHIIEEFNRGIFDYLIATDDSIDHDQDSSDDEGKDDEGNEDEESRDDEETEENLKQTKLSNDKAYGVSRGVDFKGVSFVVNYEFPTSVRSYTHRIGRTARGGASGTALSLVSEDVYEESVQLEKVQASQAPKTTPNSGDSELKSGEVSNGIILQPSLLAFDIKEIDCFRYRVEDVRRAVTRVGIREARLQDIKKEILNSSKLQCHFEDNPRDLNTLRHDKAIGLAKVQHHLAKIPSYLVPEALQTNSKPKKKQNKHHASQRFNKKRRTDNDPLHTFEHSGGNKEKHASEENEGGTDKEDRIYYGDAGVGKSISGRQSWQQKHRKGRYNPRTLSKKKRKDGLGYSH